MLSLPGQFYGQDSIPYHQYAKCSSVNIDHGNRRICLTYHIEIGHDADNGMVSLEDLKTFLPFIYKRIGKLNQERQYARYYCPLLEAFKEVSATFTFWHRGQEIVCDLDPITLSDLVVPGDPQKGVVEKDEKYRETTLINKLSNAIDGMSDQSRGGQ